MTSEYDTGQYGNIFSVATNGTNYQNILSFTANGGTASGQSPFGGLTLSGTTFYAMLYGGGSNGVNSTARLQRGHQRDELSTPCFL